jgi:hypothetical protein
MMEFQKASAGKTAGRDANSKHHTESSPVVLVIKYLTTEWPL